VPVKFKIDLALMIRFAAPEHYFVFAFLTIMYLRKVIISTFSLDFAYDVAKYNHVLSTVSSCSHGAHRTVCTFPTFYCPKVSRFDVSCNRPLRFSPAVGDNWQHHRCNISEYPSCNVLACHSAYQNCSPNWFSYCSSL